MPFWARTLIVLAGVGWLAPSVINAVQMQAYQDNLRGRPAHPMEALAGGTVLCLACPLLSWLTGEAAWWLIRRVRAAPPAPSSKK